jgi:predicted small secreted protein
MKTTPKRLVLILLSLALISLFGASCRNTFRGAGRDVENAGDHIQKATH